jgi:hypothetical protein
MLDVAIGDAIKASLVAGLLSIVKSYAAIKGPIGGANPSMVSTERGTEADLND